MGNLTSTLSIRLNDDVSGPAARAAGALHKLGASGNDLKKLGAASPEAARLIAQLEKLKAAADKVGAIRGAVEGVKASGAAYREARQDVARLTAELGKARTRAEALKGLKGRQDDRAAADAEVRKLERALKSATGTVGQTKSAFQASGQALRTAQASMREAGVAANGLRAAETAIGAAAAKANAELARQAGLLDRAAARADAMARASRNLARGMGDAGRAEMARRDASRRVSDGMGSPLRAARAEARAARERAAGARDELAAYRRDARRDAAGLVAGAAGVKAAHGVREGAHASLETYREFDKERRFGKAVMGLSDEEQKPLVDQAIHMGAKTKYNDVQVLASQRELAARGLNKEQVMGLMEPAANLGMSLDLSLPAAVKQMEGALFGFKKDISTLDAAKYSARQTADLQVKAAKVSGMTPEDLTQAYKYAATPARMAGVSEEMMLAFAGISKKANMGGDESGVAFRALIANAVSPTRKGKEAMLANGMDFKNYQRNPESLALDPFVKNIAAQYGVQLNKSAREGLGKVFANKDLISDPSKFTPAVAKLLSATLGGDDAKSKKSIAGAANRYRDASMQGVDVNGLIADLMKALPGNLQLANAMFGSKQGSRIATALGDPETVKHIVDELKNHSEGFSEKVSTERMAGFDGAVSRFEGAVKNLETSVGRAWDKDGSGGPLTMLTDMVGKVVQALAELPPAATQVASALALLAGGAAGALGAFRLVKMLLGYGSGAALSASAVALDGSAAALTAAAVRLGASAGVPGLPGGAPAAAAATAGGLTAGAVIGAGILASGAGLGAVLDSQVTNTASELEASAKVFEQAERSRKGGDAAKGLGYGAFAGRSAGAMPGGASALGGVRSTVTSSGGAFNDFLFGKRKDTFDLPGFGSQKPLSVPVDTSEAETKLKALGDQTIAPKVDSSALDGLKTTADETQGKLAALDGVTVAPKGDASSLQALGGVIDGLIARLGQLNAGIASAKSSASSVSVPSAGAGKQASTGAVRAAMANNFA